MQEGSLSSTSSTAFVVYRDFFGDDHSDWYEMISHCGFELHLSNNLAWKIPWMEEPGGLQSMGSLRLRHD